MIQVHIIGAGPSGSIAALSAVRHGYDVIMSEEHGEIGVPTHCSGLFSLDGLNSLKDFVDYKKVAINPIRGAVIYFGNERLEIRKKEPIAQVCSRAGLDQELAQNAESEGVKIEYGEKIIKPAQYKSKNIIGADGPFSSTAANFAFPKIGKYASTVQGFFKCRAEFKDCVQVYLSKDKFPGFFGWIIPHNEDFAEVGVGVALPNNVSKAWEHMLKIANVDKNECRPKGAAIPIRVRSRTSATRGKYKVCLVGDAAGQTKATTGGGVIFGGNCAKYAGMYNENPLRYELEWRLRFGADLFLHSNIQGALEMMSDWQIAHVGAKLRSMEFDEYLSNHGHMDKPTRMIKPELAVHLLKAFAVA